MAIQNVLAGTLGQRVLSRAKFSWLGYGVAAYVGLRLMRRYGIYPDVADRALNLIESGARSAFGISPQQGERASAHA